MSGDAGPRASTLAEAVGDGVALALGVVCLLAIPHDVRGDGWPRFEAIDGWLRHGVLHSPRYSVVGPVFAIPLYLLGLALGSPASACAWFNVVLLLLFLLLVWRELRSRVSPAALRALLLLLVFASMFPSHVQFFYGEVLTTVTVSLGILLLSRRSARAGFAWIGLGALNTPASLLGVALVAGAYARSARRLRYLLVPVLLFALSRLEGRLTRGSWWATGYEGDGGGPPSVLPYEGLPGFSYPLAFGVLSLLLSFGKGLFFFAPGILFGVRSPPSLRRAQHLLLLFVVGLVLAYARWWSWQGGWFWGPRFLLIASVPSALALALALEHPRRHPLPYNAALLGATVLAFWVGVNGLVFDTTGLGFCEKARTLEALCLYVPELSVLWHPFVDFASTVPPAGRPLALGVCALWFAVCAYVTRHLVRAVASQGAELARSWVGRTAGRWRL
ncbi:MAG TPA: hypothetical protein VKU41_31855 [Polyangiaceae bacterium]|nr:hypothetical protein [Polyangiaceae bacterium]